MQCVKCNRDVAEEAVFCNYCGERLQETCASCNAHNPMGSNFCLYCGERLRRASTTGYTTQEPFRRPADLSIHCPRCNSVNEPGSAYCYSCGLPQDESPPTSQSESRYSDTPYRYTQHSSRTTQPQILGEPAGFWERFVAYIVDSIILLLLSAAPLIPSFDSAASLQDEIFEPLSYMVFISIGTLYYATCVSVWSTTIGKRIIGCYVVRKDGYRLGFWHAAARGFVFIFLSFFYLHIIAAIMIGVRNDKRGLHDLICGTTVVRR